MPRSSGRRARVDYAKLANVVKRVRRKISGANVLTANPVNTEEVTRQPKRSRRRRRERVDEQIAPPLQEGAVQCMSCKMCFVNQSGASQKHNRHHPDCILFERKTPWSDTGSLRYDVLLRWVRKLRVVDLKAQLKKYYQKTSGKKVIPNL